LFAADWLRNVGNQVIGFDTETNAEWPWSQDFRLRLTQFSDGREAWLWPAHIESELLRDTIRDHPRFVAHFSEAEVRFVGRGLPGALRLRDNNPHVLDNQVAQAHHDPRTLLPRKESVDIRLIHPRGLKETYARQYSG